MRKNSILIAVKYKTGIYKQKYFGEYLNRLLDYYRERKGQQLLKSSAFLKFMMASKIPPLRCAHSKVVYVAVHFILSNINGV